MIYAIFYEKITLFIFILPIYHLANCQKIIVPKDGTISDIKAESDPGYGSKEEAIRLMARSPKWKPAVQNGRNVIYRQKHSITFMVN